MDENKITVTKNLLEKDQQLFFWCNHSKNRVHPERLANRLWVLMGQGYKINSVVVTRYKGWLIKRAVEAIIIVSPTKKKRSVRPASGGSIS